MTQPLVTLADWRAKVERELGGVAFDKALVHTTAEGLAVQPLYVEAPAETGVAGVPSAPFRICLRGAEVDVGDAVEAAVEARWIATEDGAAVAAALTAPGAPLLVVETAAPEAVLAALQARAPERLVGAALALGADPLAAAARGTLAPAALPAAIAALGPLARRFDAVCPRGHAVLISTLPYHDAGADAADELACALAAGASYLDALLDGGLDIDAAARHLVVQVAVGRDTFGELCKLRALRRCWHKLLAAAGARTVAPALVHAVCSSRTLTERDPWVNMLRVTTQVFAGVLGGAELVTPAAFDQAMGTPSQLGARVARNTALVLREESHLGRVVDPAGGSYYLESHTDALAREAWRRFQTLQRDGGLAAALVGGALAARFDAAWRTRPRRPGEAQGGHHRRLRVRQPGRGAAAAGRGRRRADAAAAAAPRRARRSSSCAIRAESLAAASATPGVRLLSTLVGRPPRSIARGSASPPPWSPPAGLRAREAAEPLAAAVAIICGSDERYATEAADRARAAQAAGCARVLLAGRPGALETRAARGRRRRLHLRRLRRGRGARRRAGRSVVSKLPDYAALDYDAIATPTAAAAAPAAAPAPTWDTPEGIPHRPRYDAADFASVDHLGTLPGYPPYLRGPYPTMYVQRPWTVRQYAGFSTAEDSNAFYRRNLAAGQKGLSIAFDLATHRGYDSDHPRVVGDVGMAGVAIDSILDMRMLFDRHPARRDERVDDDERRGAAGAGALHRRRRGAGRGAVETGRHDPERHPQRVHGAQHVHLSARALDADHRRHLRVHRDADAEVQLDLDLRLSHAGGRSDGRPRAGLHAGRRPRVRAHRHRRRTGRRRVRAPHLVLLRHRHELLHGGGQAAGGAHPVGQVHRAVRLRRTRSRSMLRTHCQTSGWSLAAQDDPMNNVARTCIEAVAATSGHTQSLHTNSFDEALALPTDFSARIARNTQLQLQQESGTTRPVDPWGGSHYVEWLTAQLAARAQAHIDEVEAMGGMAKAIEAGVPKLRIEEAAARTQARIDAGRQVIVGVNRFRPAREGAGADVLKVDNAAVRRAQLERLEVAAERDRPPCTRALDALTGCAEGKGGNLLELAVAAGRVRASVGEISWALEKAWGRHRAEIRAISGVYSGEVGETSDAVLKVRGRTAGFLAREGRRPRILVAKMGQDGHDRGQKVIASAFADLGFDVDIGPLFQTPAEVARQAVENDVHVVGASSLAAGHLTLVPALRAALAALGRDDILIVVGGVIPPDDYPLLRAAGAAEIFGPGTVIADAAARAARPARVAGA